MPFCPKCRYEYREGIGECPDCGAILVEELEEESTESIEEESTQGIVEESNQITKEESIQSIEHPLIKSLNFGTLKNLPSRDHARALREALDEVWIPSILNGATIWVPEEDLKKAQEIADQAFDNI